MLGERPEKVKKQQIRFIFILRRKWKRKMLGAGHLRYGRFSEEVAFELRASGGRGGLPQS